MLQLAPPIKPVIYRLKRPLKILIGMQWIGPAPYRGYHMDLSLSLGDKRWGMWRDYKPFGGGMITDWGAHMFDIVQWALDQDHSGPVQFNPPSTPAESGLTFTYGNGIKVTHTKWGNGNNEIQFIGTEGSFGSKSRVFKNLSK